jgi:superfamily I DNA and/or RNA helicase
VRDAGYVLPVEPRTIGVVCAHVSQVNAVRERLPRGFEDVFVETADRFQGLERPVMLVYHPLSGRADADQFHLDAGRLCVALSRHRVACLLVGRTGVEDLLLRYAPSGERVLGSDEDREYAGWRAQVSIAQMLRTAGRVLRLPSPLP